MNKPTVSAKLSTITSSVISFLSGSRSTLLFLAENSDSIACQHHCFHDSQSCRMKVGILCCLYCSLFQYFIFVKYFYFQLPAQGTPQFSNHVSNSIERFHKSLQSGFTNLYLILPVLVSAELHVWKTNFRVRNESVCFKLNNKN